MEIEYRYILYTNPNCTKCQLIKRLIKQNLVDDSTIIDQKAPRGVQYPMLIDSKTQEYYVGYFKIKNHLLNLCKKNQPTLPAS